MDFDLLPTVSLRPRSFNALVAQNEMFAKALNRNLNLQRFKVSTSAGTTHQFSADWTTGFRIWRSAEPSQSFSSRPFLKRPATP
ncbi:MAG: hypothetical protein ABR985_00680 [Methanotrichaceae archaeon]